MLSRRALVAGGVTLGAGAVLGACSTDDGDTGSRRPTGTAALAPDVAVATTALDQIRAAREAVDATVARFPATRASLGPLGTLHRTHEASLADAVPDRARPSTTPAPYAVPRRRAAAVRAVARREQRLHDSLGALALKAESGGFARLLASMGAALGQRLTTDLA